MDPINRLIFPFRVAGEIIENGLAKRFRAIRHPGIGGGHLNITNLWGRPRRDEIQKHHPERTVLARHLIARLNKPAAHINGFHKLDRDPLPISIPRNITQE